jgi:spore coat polysaccharide biosynthesis predicted glycosyltransferase SpsG
MKVASGLIYEAISLCLDSKVFIFLDRQQKRQALLYTLKILSSYLTKSRKENHFNLQNN